MTKQAVFVREQIEKVLGHRLKPGQLLNPLVVEKMEAAGIEYLLFGKLGSKGARLMISEKEAARLAEIDWVSFIPQRKRKAVALPPADTTLLRSVYDKVAELEAWKASMEELYLEQEARVDGLHKAVEAMGEVYDKLRREVAPGAKLPDPPILPPKYLYRVTMVGGDYRVREYMEPKFPNIKFRYIEEAGAAKHNTAIRTLLPQADLVILCTQWMSHSLRDQATAFYGKEKTQKVSSLSAAESVLQVWLHEREKAKEARA